MVVPNSLKRKGALLAVTGTLLFPACADFGDRTHVLTPANEAELVVMGFSRPISLDPIEPSWYRRRFFRVEPMQMDFVKKEGIAAIRLGTNHSASMLFRHVDIPLETYPHLAWKWYVEQPVETALDEQTRNGDDHPARLFVAFKTASGRDRYMEIIWGNRLKAGAYKYIKEFPHYVARGAGDPVGAWLQEELDLMAIYRHLWPDAEPAKVFEIGLFCDTDDTGARSVSYFADVRMRRAKRDK